MKKGGLLLKKIFIKIRKPIPIGQLLYVVFIVISVIALSMNACAAETMWDKAKEIMQDVYDQICIISTVAAVVTSSIALLLMNFSKNSKTVDESRAWLKRIVISWVVLNSLGFILAYIAPQLNGGKWDGITTPS